MAKTMTNAITCNMCGKELDIWDVQEAFSIERRLGYGTKYDGDKLRLDLCCDCMEKIIDECKISPIVRCPAIRHYSDPSEMPARSDACYEISGGGVCDDGQCS